MKRTPMILTNNERDDGFGGQFQNWVWDLLYAREAVHCDFALTIPRQIEHNYENKAGFIEGLVDFTNLTKMVRVMDNSSPNRMEITHSQVYPVIQERMDFFHNSETMEQYRGIFFSDKKNPYDSQYLNIAVHIRCYNAHDHYQPSFDFSKHVKQIQKLKEIYKDKPYRIHIYSQGESVKNLLKDDTLIYHLDDPIQDTFLGFVFSDVLCIAHSSLSYIAGLIKKENVYYFPFWHKPLSNWISLDD